MTREPHSKGPFPQPPGDTHTWLTPWHTRDSPCWEISPKVPHHSGLDKGGGQRQGHTLKAPDGGHGKRLLALERVEAEAGRDS